MVRLSSTVFVMDSAQPGFTLSADNFVEIGNVLSIVCCVNLGPAASARSMAHLEFLPPSLDHSALDFSPSFRSMACLGSSFLAVGMLRPASLLFLLGGATLDSLTLLQNLARLGPVVPVFIESHLDFPLLLHSLAYSGLPTLAPGVCRSGLLLPLFEYANVDLSLPLHSSAHSDFVASISEFMHAGPSMFIRGLVCLGSFLFVFNAIKSEKTEVLSVIQTMQLGSSSLVQSPVHLDFPLFTLDFAMIDFSFSMRSFSRIDLAVSTLGMA
eukprot:s154_g40.t1